MDQPDSFCWDNLNSVLLFITAIGSLVAASASLLVYRAQKGSPGIIARTWRGRGEPSQAPDPPLVLRTVDFHQPTGPAGWVVSEVCIAKSRCKWLAVLGEPKKDATGVLIGHVFGGNWMDCVEYDPPVEKGSVLLHPAAPENPKLLFRVCLRSDLRTKRKVKVLSM